MINILNILMFTSIATYDGYESDGSCDLYASGD